VDFLLVDGPTIAVAPTMRPSGLCVSSDSDCLLWICLTSPSSHDASCGQLMGARSGRFVGLAVQWTATMTASESDQVDAGERVVDLLHCTACGEVAEVDHGEARVLEEREDARFRIVVVAGDEDYALTVGLMRV
jgi:hypothetical protein